MRSLKRRKVRPVVGGSNIYTEFVDIMGRLSWLFLQVFTIGFPLYLIGLALWFLLWKLPKEQVLLLQSAGLKPSESFVIENEFRRTIIQLLGGSALLIGLYFTRKTVMVSREGQITDRFTKAVQQLGDPKLEIRLGGIYALERIANESEKDRDNIGEILSAYIRENASWKEENKDQQRLNLPTDVQAILTVLGRRKRISLPTHFFRYWFSGEIRLFFLDLRKTDLRKADLYSVEMHNAFLSEANFS